MAWQTAERFFIASTAYFGFPLVNATWGGEGIYLFSEEDRDRLRQALRNAWAKPGAKESRVAAIQAREATEESKRRKIQISNRESTKTLRADALKSFYATPEGKAQMSAIWKQVWSTPEMKAKKSAATKAGWADPEAAALRRARMSEGKRLGWARKKAAQAEQQKID